MSERTGFQTSGYINKKGTTADNLNVMPVGYNIEDQPNADIRELPFKELVDTTGYAGDGYKGS